MKPLPTPRPDRSDSSSLSSPSPPRGLRAALVCLLLLASASACTSRHTVTHDSPAPTFAEATARVAGKDAEVLTRRGEVFRWRNVELRPDSTYGIPMATGIHDGQPAIPTSRISEVTVKSRSRGAWHGLGIGILAGALLGYVGGPSDDCESLACPTTREHQAIYGAIGGGLWGLVIGAIRGSKTVIDVRIPDGSVTSGPAAPARSRPAQKPTTPSAPLGGSPR